MRELICFDYQFHPVGQGLFASGALRTCPDGSVCFNWIYDCGTSSRNGDQIIDDTINRLTHELQWQDRIDLLVLSHFDSDHISGVVKVLKSFHVEVLLLPYLSLAQRLLVAIDQGINADDAVFDFFVDPVQYLSANSERSIGTFLYVTPSNPGEGEQQFENPVDGLNNPEQRRTRDERFVMRYERVSGTDDALEDIGRSGTGSSTQPAKSGVEFLAPRTAITVNALWEFCPYNDARYTPKSSVFYSVARLIARTLVDANNPVDRQKALDYLIAIYDAEFGTGSRMRNVISLFLYSAPFPDPSQDRLLTCCCLWGSAGPIVPCICGSGNGCTIINSSKCAVLYTGDGYLNTSRTLSDLQSTLGSDRNNQVAIFQVMHHGAKGNWHSGVAAGIAPLYSIFSSDPKGSLGHPHPFVWKDFKRYGAAQVDLDDGVGFCGAIYDK